MYRVRPVGFQRSNRNQKVSRPEIFRLRYKEGKKYREIAEILGCSDSYAWKVIAKNEGRCW